MNAVNMSIKSPQRAPAPPAKRMQLRVPAQSKVVARLPPAGRPAQPLLISARRDEAIRRAAYFHWAYRGCQAGGELADWLAAEQEVDEQLALREARVREAAYARWVKGGRVAGHDVEDWMAAEQEVDAILACHGILCGL